MLIHTIISASGWRQYLGEVALRSAAARELVPAAHAERCRSRAYGKLVFRTEATPSGRPLVDGPDGHGHERDMATGPAKECVC